MAASNRSILQVALIIRRRSRNAKNKNNNKKAQARRLEALASRSRSLPPSDPPMTSKRWLSISDAAQALRPSR